MGVSRQIYLGDYLDVPFCRVIDDLFDLRLGVVAAVRFAVAAGALALAAYLMQLGEGVYAQAEALIVADVEVQVVELEQRHRVDELLDRFHAVEVTADVDHTRAVAETGFVIDGAGGKVRLQRSARELQEGDRGVEEPLVVARRGGDAFGGDPQHIVPLRLPLDELHRGTCVRASEEGRDDGEIGRHFPVRAEGEAALRHLDPERFGQNVHISSDARRRAGAMFSCALSA